MGKKIIIISGLPRSGTSTMMQMLKAGGLKTLTDNKRKADSDNPEGYFELEKVKDLKNDNSWLKRAIGKCLKIVSPLLPYLDPKLDYKIIFMERNLDEILISQKEMIRRKKQKDKISDQKMKNSFKKHLKEVKSWLKLQPNLKILFVSYNKTIKNPQMVSRKMKQFLGKTLDVKKMALAVNPSLYRQRKV